MLMVVSACKIAETGIEKSSSSWRIHRSASDDVDGKWCFWKIWDRRCITPVPKLVVVIDPNRKCRLHPLCCWQVVDDEQEEQ